METERIFISGHANMDFDCMGSALAVSRFFHKHKGKKTYIISKSGGIEPQLMEAFYGYEEKLSLRHNFISDEEASTMIGENDLLFVVDDHSPRTIRCAEKFGGGPANHYYRSPSQK